MSITKSKVIEVEPAFFITNEEVFDKDEFVDPLKAELTSIVWGMIPSGLVIFLTLLKKRPETPKFTAVVLSLKMLKNTAFQLSR